MRASCDIAPASFETAASASGEIVPGSTSRKSPKPTSAATNDVRTVNVSVRAKTFPIDLPSQRDAIAVRIASATVGTATNWKSRVYADATKSMKPLIQPTPSEPRMPPTTSAHVQMMTCLNFII